MAQQYVILQFRNYSENTTVVSPLIRLKRIQAIEDGINSLFTGVSTTTFNYSAWETILRSASGSSYYQTVTIPVSGSKQTVPYSFTSTAKNGLPVVHHYRQEVLSIWLMLYTREGEALQR